MSSKHERQSRRYEHGRRGPPVLPPPVFCDQPTLPVFGEKPPRAAFVDQPARHVSPTRSLFADQPSRSRPVSRDHSARPMFVDQATSGNDPVHRFRNAESVTMSPELFEKLFLAQRGTLPQHNVTEGELASVDWRKSLGNPAPIALVGIIIVLTPLSFDLMGFLGAGGDGAAGVASYYFFGGVLLMLAAVLEWVLGNTFPSVVYSAYGAFFFSFAGTLTPSFGAYSAYALPGEDPTAGLKTQGFNATFGWFLVWMCVLSFVFLVCSLRTNVASVAIFASLVGDYLCLSIAYFLLAANFAGNSGVATTFIKAGGAFTFTAALASWWSFVSIMLATLDFPWTIPVGDLSGWIQAGSSMPHRLDA